MIFQDTRIPGVTLIRSEPVEDERGLFARTFCEREFAARDLAARFVQCNVSFNFRAGTLRGMHYQSEPKPEPKLVRCTKGAIYDVALDLRPGSPTYCCWEAFELTERNRAALYIPPGCAHGFQTLVDGSEVFYQMGEFYDPTLSAGVRWNDSSFSITWPIENPILSDRDRSYGDFER